jgi:hypothetical protein
VSARRCAIGVVIATLAVIPTATVAHAETGHGEFGGSPPALGVGLRVTVAGTDGTGSTTYSDDDPELPRLLFTRAVPALPAGEGVSGLGNLCQVPGTPHDPAFPLGNGWNFEIQLFRSSDGAYLATIGGFCQPLDPDAPNEPPVPPPVTQPPTIGEIWRSIALPVPSIGASPSVRGITGLSTRVWTDGSGPVAIAVSLGGFTITGTANVTGYGVFAGEDGWISSAEAGAADDPAAEHTYETIGTYRLGVATRWSASAVISGPGLVTPLTIDLGTAIVTNGRDYPVVQIRSRLVG